MNSTATGLPKWLVEIKYEMESALLQLEGTYKILSEVKDKSDESYYSNSVLHAQVNKEQSYKEILMNLELEKKHINKMLIENQTLWDKKLLESLTKSSEIDALKSRFMLLLDQWRDKAKKARQAFEVADQEFQKIKQKVEANKAIKNWSQSLVQDYALFLKQFGDIAVPVDYKLLDGDYGYFDQCQSKEPLTALTVFSQMNDLLRAIPVNYKAIAELTKDEILIKQASILLTEMNAYSENQRTLLVNGLPGIQRLEKTRYVKTVIDANQLAKEYMDAADKLEQESKVAFDEIQKDKTQLEAQLHEICDPVKGQVNQARRHFIVAKTELTKAYKVRKNAENTSTKSFNELRKEMLFHYDQMCEAFAQAKVICDSSYQKKSDITKKYLHAVETYGASRSEEVYYFILNAKVNISELENIIDIAKPVVEENEKMIFRQRATSIQERLLEILKGAIENNIAFWNRQISKLGSRYAIGKVKVPHGIALLYKDLQFLDLHSGPSQVLKTLKATVSLRKAAGNGFFAQRSRTTTDKFYDLIQGLDIDNVTENVLKEVQKNLGQIKDAHGSLYISKAKAVQPEVVDEIVELNKFKMPLSPA